MDECMRLRGIHRMQGFHTFAWGLEGYFNVCGILSGSEVEPPQVVVDVEALA